jgi:hypothetical protein
MQNRKIKRFIYQVRHEYVTMNNIVLAVAAVIAISWTWASVQAVQRNYALQREVDDKYRQQQLIQLQTDSLTYEQHYYGSREYQTLEVKRRLGLAEPGEKVLVLPPNSAAAKASDTADQASSTVIPAEAPPPPPLQQWLNFLFGGNRTHPDNP